MAVRSNVGDLADMKKAMVAAWCHVSSSEKWDYHIHWYSTCKSSS